ncbi:uncharacterized protein LOC124353773 [Homalodisca vitripennis]|uniref:uncharacterized protein LOC124353773 n=1 Tax=Homalodisca vitripennis TaxID=197043 RepID=UPI001EEC9A68|nr:uncharacterized protein LOC124353773 [Homalodisca vitripennis]
MRLFVLVVITLCSQLIVLEAAVPVPRNISNSSGCFLDGKSFQAGEQYDIPGECFLYVCEGNEQWKTATCRSDFVPIGWTSVPGDTTKPYPQCCGRLIPPK